MATVGALQDQELMTQGKDFSLQSNLSSEAGSHGEKQGDKKGKHGSEQPTHLGVASSTVSMRTDFLVGTKSG